MKEVLDHQLDIIHKAINILQDLEYLRGSDEYTALSLSLLSNLREVLYKQDRSVGVCPICTGDYERVSDEGYLCCTKCTYIISLRDFAIKHLPAETKEVTKLFQAPVSEVSTEEVAKDTAMDGFWAESVYRHGDKK